VQAREKSETDAHDHKAKHLMPFIQIFDISAELLAMLERAGSCHVHNLRGGASALSLGLRRRRSGLFAEEAIAASGCRFSNVFRNFIPEATGGGRARLHRVHELSEIGRVPCIKHEKLDEKK
jgi:hypothetical protein